MPARSPTGACSPSTPSSSWRAGSSMSTKPRPLAPSEPPWSAGWPARGPSTRSPWPSGSSSSARRIPRLAPSELAPEARRARLFQSLGDLVQARARRELTVLWVEDLHWLDPASDAALAMLVGRLLAPESADRRALLLATARPEYRPAWSARVEHLVLAPLAARTPRRCSTTGSDPIPRSRRSARGSRPAPGAIPSSSRRSFARSSSSARCAANAARTRRPPRSRRSPCPRPFRPSSRRASTGSRRATRRCSRPRR